MNTEYFTEMHKLIERAKNYEKTGREQEALATYLEIHDKFFPNTSDLYERPAILLEKRKRFDEAIRICEKAVKLIDEGKITGIKDNFIRRIERIKARPDYIAEHGQAAEKKVRKPFSFKWLKENTNKPPNELPKKLTKEVIRERNKASDLIPEEERVSSNIFEKHPPKIMEKHSLDLIEKHKEEQPAPVQSLGQNQELHKETAQVHLTPEKTHIEPKPDIEDAQIHEMQTDFGRQLSMEPALSPKKGPFHRMESAFIQAKNAFTHMKKPSKKTLLFSSVILVMICGIFYGLEKNDRSKFEVFIDVSEFESTGTPIGNPFPTDLSDLPPITGSMIDTAVKSVSQMNGVSTAGVIVQKNVTGFVIMLKPGTSRSDAKNAAENFVKALGAAAAAENSDLSGPNMVSYGSLYDYYGALVVAGSSPDDLTIKGVKVPKALGFTWK